LPGKTNHEKQAMKKWWSIQSARIDALSLRERVFLFLSVMACGIALIDVLWLSPAQLEHKQLTQRFSKQSTELQRLRDEFTASPKPVDVNAVARAELAQVKARLEAIDKDIGAVSVPAVAGSTPLAQVLVHFLRKYESLTLVRTVALPPEGVAAPPVAPVAPTASGAMPVSAGITRQGLELTVAGPYPELIRMVQTLEKAMPALRWGSMRVSAETLPPQLTLQVFVVGVQP
jgi:MSHA biogenesis protein MshJ